MLKARCLTAPVRPSCVLITLLVATVPALAQNAPQKPASSSTFVTTVDEVSLDLTVRTKKNKPVLDLRPEDLQITDNGTPIKISSLRLVNGNSDSDRLVTFLFDRFDLAGADNARKVAGKILKAVPEGGFSFSVLNIRGRLGFYQEFTSDRAALTKAIQLASEAATRTTKGNDADVQEKGLYRVATRGTAEDGSRVTRERRVQAQMLVGALHDSQRLAQEQHTDAAMASLLALARDERKLQGRKIIFFFTQGLHLDGTAEEVLASVAAAANRSGVSIYTVDTNTLNEQTSQQLLSTLALGSQMTMGGNRVSAPQALTGPPDAPHGDLSTPGMAGEISIQADRFKLTSGSKGPLAALAAHTGGGYLDAGENPKKILRNMVEDMTTYYEVSYVPPIKEYDGKFRAVSVKTTRPKLKVISRAGYFATPPEHGLSARGFEAPLLKLLGSDQLPSDLKFRSSVLQLGEFETGNMHTLAVEVPLSELSTHDDANTNLYSVHCSIVAQVKNKAGDVVEQFSEDLPQHRSLDDKEHSRNDVVTMQRHFVADPGDYTVEAAVVDRLNGKAGAQRSKIQLQGAGEGPFLSDVALVQRLDPFAEDADQYEPMRYGTQRVVPNLAGHVAGGTKEISLFSIVHAAANNDQQPRLEMTVVRNNEPIAQVPLQLRKFDSAGALPYVASIHSSSLPAGNYQIIETLTQGEKVAERTLAFRIDGPEIATTTGPAKPGSDADAVTELNLAEITTMPGKEANGKRLVITTLPPGTVQAPSPEELQTIVQSARKHSLNYAKSLPNFVCLEVTNRSVDTAGTGDWKRRDSIAEMLRYVDSQETRQMVERNGERTKIDRSDLDSTWPLSVGEFGGLLNLVFKTNSKTDFQWKEAGGLGSGTIHVLNYRIDQRNATMSLSDNSGKVSVGIHGLVYIDSATGGVRRITVEADEIPKDFSMRAASMLVDYDYVTIGAHDYLMPMRAVLTLRRGKRQVDLNEITFRNYRRYASQARIVPAQ